MNDHNTKHISPSAYLLMLICMICACTCPLHAQESCYEQYLREHNMPFLTAEDADDSYEELKKEVLARQTMRREALFQPLMLAVDTISGTCHLLAQDGSLIADVHLALVDSTWYMWLSVDPLADKNISSTPYIYCSGNPIMLIDPDGRDDDWTCEGGVAKRQYVDNGTDYVRINGKLITEYDYNDPTYQAYLSQIGTYYKQEALIDQDECPVVDVTNTEYENALAYTNIRTRIVGFAICNNKLHPDANTVSNIVNSFVHEGVHKRGGGG